jgi:hypothetical protein
LFETIVFLGHQHSAIYCCFYFPWCTYSVAQPVITCWCAMLSQYYCDWLYVLEASFFFYSKLSYVYNTDGSSWCTFKFSLLCYFCVVTTLCNRCLEECTGLLLLMCYIIVSLKMKAPFSPKLWYSSTIPHGIIKQFGKS